MVRETEFREGKVDRRREVLCRYLMLVAANSSRLYLFGMCFECLMYAPSLPMDMILRTGNVADAESFALGGCHADKAVQFWSQRCQCTSREHAVLIVLVVLP